MLGQAVAQLGVPSPNWGAARDAVNSTESAETQNEVQTPVYSREDLRECVSEVWVLGH